MARFAQVFLCSLHDGAELRPGVIGVDVGQCEVEASKCLLQLALHVGPLFVGAEKVAVVGVQVAQQLVEAARYFSQPRSCIKPQRCQTVEAHGLEGIAQGIDAHNLGVDSLQQPVGGVISQALGVHALKQLLHCLRDVGDGLQSLDRGLLEVKREISQRLFEVWRVGAELFVQRARVVVALAGFAEGCACGQQATSEHPTPILARGFQASREPGEGCSAAQSLEETVDAARRARYCLADGGLLRYGVAFQAVGNAVLQRCL